MSWALVLPHYATVTIGRGKVIVSQHDGSLVTYKPPPFGALALGPVTTVGRRLELRSQ